MRSLYLQPHAPFGSRPVPPGVDIAGLPARVGTLTALHAEPQNALGTVLFVPGFTGSKEDFLDFVPLLAARGWNAWAYSQRGQADSAAPAGVDSYALEKLAADAVELAAMVSQTPVHLVGHSMGGVVAVEAAIAAPERFRSLTLLCSGPHGWPERLQETTDVISAGGSLGLWEHDNPGLLEATDEELGSEAAFYRLRATHTSSENLLATAGILRHHVDRSEALRATGLPVLITHGEDDQAWPQDWQRQMAEAIGAPYRIIPGGAHSPQRESPQATANTLDAFWRSV
ncbi:alpha/beta fold hydrolase [Psychromicrobium xiongbiense]|uniref:alpha/beta fold hydrolase n=1 Tax=Psychromicrobium xiongbiense TaxID=3051184 RepID=UPI00255529FB|nr:alpha/beta hydrolase [Psychromicrobium sp. YIM S02556]